MFNPIAYLWHTMKKYLLLSLVALSTLILVSWGFTGHRTVALIAANHLTPQAKAAVADLLNGQSMADVSTWADEVRSQPEYKHTAGWHYLNLPLGLNFEQFRKNVIYQGKGTIYFQLENMIHALNEPAVQTKEEQAEALKFLIHLVGDAHQPMHISRAEDKGGNTIQVQFDGRGTNLHSLWDSKLLDKQGMSDVQMSKELDNATPAQIKKWQSEDIIHWIWESYQISSKLYEEVKSGSKLDDAYYSKHISTVNERIEQAGIRLAGVLNYAFKSYKHTSKVIDAHDNGFEDVDTNEAKIYLAELKDAANYIGKTVSVSGEVFGSRNMGSFVLVNLGAAYPNQPLTVVLRGEAIKAFNNQQQTLSKMNTQVKSPISNGMGITGKITEYKGKPQIEVSDPKMISFGALVKEEKGTGRKGS